MTWVQRAYYRFSTNFAPDQVMKTSKFILFTKSKDEDSSLRSQMTSPFCCVDVFRTFLPSCHNLLKAPCFIMGTKVTLARRWIKDKSKIKTCRIMMANKQLKSFLVQGHRVYYINVYRNEEKTTFRQQDTFFSRIESILLMCRDMGERSKGDW